MKCETSDVAGNLEDITYCADKKNIEKVWPNVWKCHLLRYFNLYVFVHEDNKIH